VTKKKLSRKEEEELRRKRVYRTADFMAEQVAARSVSSDRRGPPPPRAIVDHFKSAEPAVQRAFANGRYDMRTLHKTIGNTAIARILETDEQRAKYERNPPGETLMRAVLERARRDRDGEAAPGEFGPGAADAPPAPAAHQPSTAEAAGGGDHVTVRDPQAGLDITYDLAGGGAPDVNLGQVKEQMGSGHPLDENTRRYMEWRFQVNFGRVRLHTGPKADALSRALFAHAFALGADVAFQGGSYRPGTKEGDRLLAHELTHVVQAGLAPRIEAPEAAHDTGALPSSALPAIRDFAPLPPSVTSITRIGESLRGLAKSGSVSEPTDAIEVEADRMADEVVSVSRGDFQAAMRDLVPGAEEEDETKKAGRQQASELVKRALAGGGQELPQALRERLEEVLGSELGEVRVHVDESASEAAQALSARAFTMGTDIVFGSGEYQPGTPGGDELIAHEITHVAQHLQGRAGVATSHEGDVPVTQAGDAVEREAEQIAGEFAQGAGEQEASAPVSGAENQSFGDKQEATAPAETAAEKGIDTESANNTLMTAGEATAARNIKRDTGNKIKRESDDKIKRETDDSDTEDKIKRETANKDGQENQAPGEADQSNETLAKFQEVRRVLKELNLITKTFTDGAPKELIGEANKVLKSIDIVWTILDEAEEIIVREDDKTFVEKEMEVLAVIDETIINKGVIGPIKFILEFVSQVVDNVLDPRPSTPFPLASPLGTGMELKHSEPGAPWDTPELQQETKLWEERQKTKENGEGLIGIQLLLDELIGVAEDAQACVTYALDTLGQGELPEGVCAPDEEKKATTTKTTTTEEKTIEEVMAYMPPVVAKEVSKLRDKKKKDDELVDQFQGVMGSLLYGPPTSDKSQVETKPTETKPTETKKATTTKTTTTEEKKIEEVMPYAPPVVAEEVDARGKELEVVDSLKASGVDSSGLDTALEYRAEKEEILEELGDFSYEDTMSKLTGRSWEKPGKVQTKPSKGKPKAADRSASGEMDIVETAERGFAGGGGKLPHLDSIQESFGSHDISGIKATVGGPAKEASEAIGAEAYASGDKVAFKQGPDLHTAAHEAAHVVQQRGGVSLKGSVGKAGDRYEQHADAVADAVVAGKSAEALLDPFAGGTPGLQQKAVQRSVSETCPPQETTEEKTLNNALADKDIAEALTTLYKVDENDFRSLVQGMSADDTRWLLKAGEPVTPQDVVAPLLQRIKAERVVAAALDLEDELYWAGPSGHGMFGKIKKKAEERPVDDYQSGDKETNTNDFAVWIRGGDEPTSASKMNCWQAVLYSAYKGGVISEKWLEDLHEEMQDSWLQWTEGDYYGPLIKALGYGNAQEMTSQRPPGRGDIVFMEGEKGPLSHVALSLGSTDGAGNHEVLSLWILPRDGGKLNSTFQRTTIEELNDATTADYEIFFAPCPF